MLPETNVSLLGDIRSFSLISENGASEPEQTGPVLRYQGLKLRLEGHLYKMTQTTPSRLQLNDKNVEGSLKMEARSTLFILGSIEIEIEIEIGIQIECTDLQRFNKFSIPISISIVALT